MSKKYVRPSDYIKPININGLEGRYISVPAQSKNSKTQILVVYDMNSNIEQWWGLLAALSRYGKVTMVDLPGIGGMESFYKIKVSPSLDNYADYLASVVKLKFKRGKVAIVGIGFGFTVVTKMLQRNNDLLKKPSILIAMNGYTHFDDLAINRTKRMNRSFQETVKATALVSFILKNTLYTQLALEYKYDLNSEKKPVKNRRYLEKRFLIDLEMECDQRTRYSIIRQMLNLDLCSVKVPGRLWHITTPIQSPVVKPNVVEQHARIIYEDYKRLPAKGIKSIPVVLNDEKTALKLLPARIRRELKSLSSKKL